jgi:hypothetical protein
MPARYSVYPQKQTSIGGSGADIAGPTVFLASDDARYTTGSVVGADGDQAVGYFLSVPGRRFSGGRID